MVSPYFWSRFRMTEKWEITKLSDGTAEVRCFRDDFQVYKFGMASLIAAAAVLGGKIHALHILPALIFNRDDVHRDVIGRAVYYREFPAIIQDFDGENGRVRLRSDSPHHIGFPPQPWDDLLSENDQDVWEDLLSPHIHWHREVECGRL